MKFYCNCVFVDMFYKLLNFECDCFEKRLKKAKILDLMHGLIYHSLVYLIGAFLTILIVGLSAKRTVTVCDDRLKK